MSTYLVAFVVCDFDIVSKISAKNVNVSVIAAKDKIAQAEFALQSSTKIMDFYDDFFGVSYPLDKQDLIAIPEFGAGSFILFLHIFRNYFEYSVH
jgi:aminopeptidase N